MLNTIREALESIYGGQPKNSIIMDFYGKVKEILEPVSGTSSRGLWVRQTIVLEAFDNPSNILAIDALNERCEKVQQFQPGTPVKATFGVSSRKGENGYFTSVNLWDIQKL